MLDREYGLDNSGAEQVIEYILQGRAILGAVPTHDTIIAERFFDEGGGMQLVIHSPYGSRINKAWGIALRKCFCVSFNFELQASANENGLNISLAEQHSFPLEDVFNFLSPLSVKHILEQASLQSPHFYDSLSLGCNTLISVAPISGRQESATIHSALAHG